MSHPFIFWWVEGVQFNISIASIWLEKFCLHSSIFRCTISSFLRNCTLLPVYNSCSSQLHPFPSNPESWWEIMHSFWPEIFWFYCIQPFGSEKLFFRRMPRVVTGNLRKSRFKNKSWLWKLEYSIPTLRILLVPKAFLLLDITHPPLPSWNGTNEAMFCV